MITGLLELLFISDGAIAVDQSQQGVGGALGIGIIRDHVFEVDDRGIECLATHIENAGLVRLLGKLILEPADVRARARGRVAVGEPSGQLLIDRQRGLAVRRIELGAAPEDGAAGRALAEIVL